MMARQLPVQNESKTGDINDITHVLHCATKLKSMPARLVACNGDCGSQISLIINQCVTGTVMYKIHAFFTYYRYITRPKTNHRLHQSKK